MYCNVWPLPWQVKTLRWQPQLEDITVLLLQHQIKQSANKELRQHWSFTFLDFLVVYNLKWDIFPVCKNIIWDSWIIYVNNLKKWRTQCFCIRWVLLVCDNWSAGQGLARSNQGIVPGCCIEGGEAKGKTLDAQLSPSVLSCGIITKKMNSFVGRLGSVLEIRWGAPSFRRSLE